MLTIFLLGLDVAADAVDDDDDGFESLIEDERKREKEEMKITLREYGAIQHNRRQDCDSNDNFEKGKNLSSSRQQDWIFIVHSAQLFIINCGCPFNTSI